MMDISWLQDFLTLAETRNFTKAAERRNSSQAAFSRRVQALEAWLGTPLVDRSIFPVELTPEGHRFRDQARDVLSQILDARLSLSEGLATRHDHVSIALPHAIGTGRFPDWWREWSSEMSLTCTLLPGNVGDAVNALISGVADILIYYHNPQQPLHLDVRRYEQLALGEEVLRPYAARHLVESGEIALPPHDNQAVPYIGYGSESYLARMVDLIFDTQPVKVRRAPTATCSMADVLRELTVTGQGVAWLPDAVIDEEARTRLAVVGDPSWTMTLSVIAYRDRDQSSAAVDRLWQKMRTMYGHVSPVRPAGSTVRNGRVKPLPRRAPARGKLRSYPQSLPQ